MRGVRYRLVALVTMLAVMATCVWPLRARAEQQTITTSHAIAVAYDNSGSMYFDYDQPGDAMEYPIDRWSNAKYSMEVLAAMLGESDSLTIYTMDRDDPLLTLDGTQSMSERVSTVHDTNFADADGTYIDPIMHAIASLEASDADEKYLIIATDGQFFRDRNNYSGQLGMGLDETVNHYIDQASEDGITTIYLAISSDAPISADPSRNIYVETPDSTEILSTVLDVSNLVFGRAELPRQYWDADSGHISFDIPMSNVVVLAQGANASLGQLSGEVDVPGVQSPVSYSQVGFPETESIVNERLRGVVGVYDAEMPSGEYALDVSGAESIAIYYMPYVDIAVELKRGDGSVERLSATEANELYEGEYEADIALLDPFTGEEIDSPLMDGAVTTLEVENGGTSMVLQPGEPFELVPGDVSIRAVADVPGGVRVVQQFQTSEITSALRGLVVDASGVPAQARYDRPDSDEAHPEGTVVVSKEDGTEISAEEWVIMELTYSSPDGLEWELEKTSQIGLFNVRLASTGPKPSIFEWVQIHLLPHVSGGAARSTTFTAQVSSTMSNLGGTQQATTSLVGTFMWWIWVIIAIISAIILRFLTKPRLPNLAPAIDLGDGHGPRKVKGAIIRDTSPLSLMPERAHFIVSAQGKKETTVQGMVGLTTISLVATGGSGRMRKCKLDKGTAEQVHRMNNGTPKAKCGAVDPQGNPTDMTETYVMQLTRGPIDAPRKIKIHLKYQPKAQGGRAGRGRRGH